MFERVVDLPWPRSLFGNNVSLAEIQAAELALGQKNSADLCICGKEHRKLYPRTKRSDYGMGFNVYYYCSDACKANAVQAESGQVNGH